tara:strand:- start:207 stop:608 length:402 start_codon:yes stop_codon:yes gene_type:complete
MLKKELQRFTKLGYFLKKAKQKYIKKEYKQGIIYTLYSDKSNLIEVGFTIDNKTIEDKLIDEKLILLDRKKGSLKDLRILKETLNQLGLFIFNNKYYKCTELSLRHMNTLGWPIGNSLYKQRVIKKKISYVIN